MSRYAKRLTVFVLGLALFIQAIPATVCAMGCAMNLGTTVVAETVETKAKLPEPGVMAADHSCCLPQAQTSKDELPKERHSASKPNCCCVQMTSCSSLSEPVKSYAVAPTVFDTVAILPEPTTQPFIAFTDVEPGIFGNDSGPPGDIADSPWLGRAPPVSLA